MLNAIRFYRLARWLFLHHIPFLPKLIQLLIFVTYNCSINYRTEIGEGTMLSHGGIGVLINTKCQIGKHCMIGNNASIVGQAPYKYCPRIGNNVYIGSGAVIQGPVIIEDNVIIAPNAVVNKSVPANMIVAGVPAKIIGDATKLGYNIFANEAWNEDTKPFLSAH